MNSNFFRLKRLLPLFLLFESLSFLAWYFPALNSTVFIVIFLIAIYLTFKKLEYGLYLVFAELLIGSKGYLFWLPIGDFKISIRIALWLAVILVWKYKIVADYLAQKNFKLFLENLKIPFAWPFGALMFFTVIGILNGILSGNSLKTVFFDMNAWLYFLLIWPLYAFYKNANIKEKRIFIHVMFAASIWLMIKTWLLLYFFSHDFPIINDIYRWVRDTGVGEITAMKAGFYRIFIQSHIYSLFALIILLIKVLSGIKLRTFNELIKSKKYWRELILASGFFSVILIGLSRSFWVALIVGLAVLFIPWFIAIKRDNKLGHVLIKLASAAMSLLMVLIFSLLIVFAIIKFPIPRNLADFNATSVLSDRVSQSNESAISSRWALLPELWSSISTHPLLGSGFGETVTYYSEDPRVLVNNPTGTYTTYAFEWGWLDIWLKIGLLGLLCYIWLIGAQAYQVGHLKGEFKPVAAVSILAIMAALAVVHVFTPYLNHPLGIGLIVLISVILSRPEDLPDLLI